MNGNVATTPLRVSLDTTAPPLAETAIRRTPRPDREKSRVPLGELLRARGLVREEQIRYALQEQKITRERIGEVLERCGFVTQYDVATAVAGQEGLAYYDGEPAPEAEALRLFSLNLCAVHSFLPLRIVGPEVHVATSNSDLEAVHQAVARHSGLTPVIALAEKSTIKKAIQHHYDPSDQPVEDLLRREIADLSVDDDQVKALDTLVDSLFRFAVQFRASDIHIRPTARSINVAFRIDGMLRPMLSLVPDLRRIISTIKIRARMDIAEQRLPQDGGFSVRLLDTEFDVRVSSTVTPHGENIVLRILPRNVGPLRFEELGFLKPDVCALMRMFDHPNGLILLTGPTGSGKTTTLFAGVRGQDLLGKNVLTVENPIEYRLPLIHQTEVNERAGYTFASAIRHFLRHDPDIILVGEIRDAETAQTAVTAAETGHLVLSTLHTNDVFGALPRLRSLGVPEPMIADALLGVVSQRLVRRLCDHCKESYTPDREARHYLAGQAPETIWRGRGCEVCLDTGFYGRVPIYEILRIDRELSAAISQGDRLEAVRHIAEARGFEPLLATAIKKIASGETSVAEVRRVLGSRE